MRIPVKFKNATDASKFVVLCNTFEEDVNLYYKRYIIDAKSILGVLSCDFYETLEVEILSDDTNTQQSFQKAIGDLNG